MTSSAAPSTSPTPASGLSARDSLKLDEDPTEAWAMLHRRLQALHQQRVGKQEFLFRLEQIAAGIDHLTRTRQDDSLFVLVQMLFDREFGYSATHALLSATTCGIIAPIAGLPEGDHAPLTRAALTMNIGMSQLHDQLAQQVQPADTMQRAQIAEHPRLSSALLRECGVDDPLWLQLVDDHHESPDGSGYPGGKTDLPMAQQMLHMSDVFVARISPRSSRRGLAPNVAVGNLYLEAQEQSSQLGAIFVKQLGMYPPGTYVRLKSEETAVVVRRGQRVNTPVAMAIADAEGMPLTTPSRRDTQIPSYSVKGSVAPEDIKIRMDRSRLLKRI
jgi:HD-GYP domain-containing protein (c-di-GMP phosphodiesterase class II)